MTFFVILHYRFKCHYEDYIHIYKVLVLNILNSKINCKLGVLYNVSLNIQFVNIQNPDSSTPKPTCNIKNMVKQTVTFRKGKAKIDTYKARSEILVQKAEETVDTTLYEAFVDIAPTKGKTLVI